MAHQPIAGAHRLDPPRVWAELPTQPGHLGLQCPGRIGGERIGPQRLHQLIGSEGPTSSRDQHREQEPLARAALDDGHAALSHDQERTEHPDLHTAPFDEIRDSLALRSGRAPRDRRGGPSSLRQRQLSVEHRARFRRHSFDHHPGAAPSGVVNQARTCDLPSGAVTPGRWGTSVRRDATTRHGHNDTGATSPDQADDFRGA
jgi:hypothetical protein